MKGVIVRVITVFAAVAAVLLVGCATTNAPSDSANPAASSPLSTLTIGQCTDQIDAGKNPSFTVVDCADDHAWEVASIVPADGDTYPGEAALRALADSNCASALDDYVGVDPASTAFAVTFLAPNAAHWVDPANRKVVCLVGAASGGLTGSLKDKAYSFPVTGQCFAMPTSGSFALDLVPCSQEHAYEVYATKKLSGKQPPTTAAFNKVYASVCVSGFKDFVGIDAGKSKYEILYFLMPDSLWSKLSDHRLVCAAGWPTGQITGSLRDVKE